MLTNNFLNLAKIIMLGSNYSYTTPIVAKTVSNANWYLLTGNTNSYPIQDSSNSFTLLASNRGWSVGSGNTPESVNDYQLENTINDGLSGTCSVTKIYDSENNKIIKRCTITITNTSLNDITINEIGYKEHLRGASTINVSSTSQETALMYRKVLDAPIILESTDMVSFIVDFYIDLT